MGRYASVAAVSQAAASNAPWGLNWWLLVGGIAGTVITFVLSSVLYRAFCRWHRRGLETACLLIGLAGMAGAPVALAGAGWIVTGAPSGPPAGTGAFLLLLAGAVGVGAALVGACFLDRGSVAPQRASMRPPTGEFIGVIALVAVADLVVAGLAVLGAAGVVHLSLVQALAWGCVGVGLGVLAALVLAGLAWTLAAIAGA